MSDSIKVAIKVRPLIKREKDENLPIQWVVQGNSIVSIDSEMKKRGDGGFYFDHIFDMNTSNSYVFDTIVKPIVNAAVNGFNGTVFAYGQTSSGKTYTMMGTTEEPGIIPLAIEYMFDAISNTGREFLLRVSYLEIYNERVNDLLNKSGTDLKLKEDGNGQVVLQCKEEITNSPENVLSIMRKGDKNRRTGETNMNERSSRSHTIFRITIESREAGGDSDGAIQVSQLNLVDLAGSERARQTGATGERFKEGRHINLSLSTLGLVIMQLSESQDNQKHVNFRDSKLTRLLQTSLGGNAMTAIICAVTPAALEETQCTLSFASRAKSVRNKPQINEVMSDAALLKRYAKQLTKLQQELQRIKNENRSAEVEEMESKLQEKDRINQLLEERIELLKTRIVSGDITSQEESFKYKSKRRQTWGGPGMFNQHLSAFQSKTNLPTIKEVSFEKPQRKSIIQSMDIMHQTFQTAFADFELELFQSERDRESKGSISDSDEEPFVTKRKNRVTFKDDVFTIKSKNNSFDVTPEKYNISTQTMDCQTSPSTPKHVLRRCITDLTREFVELREFTTLEKQLICRDNHCFARENAQTLMEMEQHLKHISNNGTDLKQIEQKEPAAECYNTECISEVKNQLASLNLAEETDINRVIIELCIKLNGVEKQNNLEKDANRKAMEQFSELEKRIENAISERNEFEYISRELRAELKKKTMELELKNMTEEDIKQEGIKKISELEKTIETITLEKNQSERINTELRTESAKKIAELQELIKNITSERNEFEHMRRELCIELNKKSLELEKLKNNSDITDIQVAYNKITELEKEIENITLAKNKFEHINTDLSAELNRISLELESKIDSERIEKQKAIEKVSELEKHIEQVTLDKNQAERNNVEFKTKLDKEITDLEAKILSEQTANQEVMKKVSELEKQIEYITSEKDKLEHVNGELHKNVSELKSTIALQQDAQQEATERIIELEREIENITSEKNKFECINMELSAELNKKTSELQANETLQQTENQRILENISELEKRIESLTSENNDLERISTELRAELNHRTSELNAKLTSKDSENQKAMEKISEFKKQIGNMESEKNELGRTNNELRAEINKKTFELETKAAVDQTEYLKAMEKISELEAQITNMISEKNELGRINSELHAELNQKISEMEVNVSIKEAEYLKAMDKISELEAQITNMMSEKNQLEHMNSELHAKLRQKTSKSKMKATIEQYEYLKTMEKMSELETFVTNIISENSELECMNSELHAELSQKTSELEVNALMKGTEYLKAMEKISELETQITNMISEKNELERINNELHTELSQKTSESEVKTSTEQSEYLKAMEKISELETQITNMISEKNELERINHDLHVKLDQKTSDLESKIISEQSENVETMKEISKLEKEIENVTSEKNQFDHTNHELYDESTKNVCELEPKSEWDYMHENQDFKDQVENQSILSYSKISEGNADTSNLIVHIEAEKSQLEENLQLKSQELEDIKNDVQSLKMDIQNLQETIYLLTTENMEMANKLTIEQENARQREFNLQKTIDELYMRISEVTNEKISLESDLETLNDQLESMNSRIQETNSEEQLFATYQNKIDKLTAENIELSASIAEKNKELESIKESKSLLYDHECMYKEKISVLTERNKCLLTENDELSTDLIDKIEENDALKEQCNILQNKIEQLLAQNENFTENNMENLRTENNTLKAKLAELKTKITVLSDENAKFSNNLLETMENLDSSRNERSCNNTLHLSTIYNNSTKISEVAHEATQEENYEILANKVTILQNEIDHLTILNKKLSDLKLTSCSQCTHLRNLNESRRALKLETKILNQKLQDLQKRFDRKCADTEILKNKINQELNSSEHDVSLNGSFVNDTDLSFVEQKIQSLNDELQTLRTDHDKLSILYEDKCNELEKLQSGMIENATITNSNCTPRKGSNRNRNRIEQLQNYIDQLKNDIDELKKNSTNFTDLFNQFKVEKTTLLDEINALKETNEELQRKVTNNESTATKKVQILENELANMNREIEQFSTREKELESQRLMLEVELEALKIKEQNKSTMITQLNEHISSLKNELDVITNQKNELINSNTVKHKKEELDCLKKQCEDLQKEKVRYKELEQCNTLRIKELETYINNLETNIKNQECLSKELQEKGFHLEKLLQESEQAKCILTQKLQTAETEFIDLRNNLEIKYKNEFDSISVQYQQHIKESENNLQQLNDILNKHIGENLKLTQELADLQSIKEKFNEMVKEKEGVFNTEKVLINDKEKLKEELHDIKNCMIKELISLKCNVDSIDISNKSVNEIFVVLLQTLILKEKEVIKTIRTTYEKDKRKLEDEKQQCVDVEKRATAWAKELEAEIEKLQTELMERERAHKEYQNKIAQLEHLLRENTHEKEMLKEKVEALETDLNNLQIEFDKQCKIDNQQGEAVFVAQKREKEAQDMFKKKEIELQSKMNSEKEMYEKKINDLVYSIESYKTKNLELNSTIEGLEANEKQLKNIIEANSIEMKRKSQNEKKMNIELEQLIQEYNRLNQEMEQKNSHIGEITAILKSKCDMLSEYKTKLETVIPEYEMLKEHVKDQTSIIQRHKEEIQILKKEREEQLEIIKDKLNSEEIKNAGLSKQLNELNNKNIALIEELNGLKEKYDELQQANEKLEKKIRNSTSKIKAEAEIEELKELNKRLQNNLDGASNRVVELQEMKNQILKELVDFKSKYELILQENAEMKTTLLSYKSKYFTSSSMIDEGKYDALLLEKNKIALELEGKKLILNQSDKKLKEYARQIQQLTDKNKELDEEVEEYATIIRERDTEISKLEDKLNSLSENTLTSEIEQKLKGLNEENEKLRDQVEALKMRLQMDVEMDIKSQNEKTIRALKEENLELQIKTNDYKKQLEMRMNRDDNELKGIHMDRLRNSDKKLHGNFESVCNRITELEEGKNKLIKELETQKLLLSQKDKELKKYINKVHDLTAKNKELDTELEEYATTIRSNHAEISKFESALNLHQSDNELVGNLKRKLEVFSVENKKLKNEITELQMKLKIDVHNEGVTLRKENTKKPLQTSMLKDLSEYEDKCQELRKKIHELELQLVSKNGKIATLEIQIQSENFPYQRKCKELEELVLAFRNKNAELNSEIRKLKKAMNDTNAWECGICRRWRVNRKDEACQTIPTNTIRFCDTSTGVVQDHVKIQKLEKEKSLMRDLCRSRSRQIKELEDRIKELEHIQGSLISRMN